MEGENHDGKADANGQHREGELRASPASVSGTTLPLSSPCEGASGKDMGTPVGSEQMEPFNNNIPVFLDRTFRMIESVSDDIVCWSEAGDSFIIKQVLVFEGLLPTFYNHNKFLSFVRQLNFYGFKKVRAGASLRSSPGDTQGAGAGAPSDSWEEFRHPHFRRGRRDLLAGIKRQKDGGRLKRKQAESQKSDALSSLTADVDKLSGDLRALHGKVDDMMSLLLDIAGGPGRSGLGSEPAPRNVLVHPQNNNHVVVGGPGVVFNSGGGGGGGGGGSGGGGGGAQASFIPAAAPAPTVRGTAPGEGGYGQWVIGTGMGNGGISQVGQDPSLYGTPMGNYITQRLPVDQQQQQHPQQQQQQLQQWQGHVYQQQYQQATPAEQYQVAPNQVRYQVVQPQPMLAPPTSTATVAAPTHASESVPSGQMRQQLPCQGVPLSGVSANNGPTPEQMQSARGVNSAEVRPANRGLRSGGGMDVEGTYYMAATEPRDGQPQQQPQPQPQQQQQR